ncbi:MAG: T9SS type A sorting domain-containing protein [Bacteroidetes bacterium]|nr:T9SS type A sorting domain-containing protein [Bacteroidota bacterium]
MAISTKSNAQPYYYNSGIPTLFANWGNQPGGTGTPPSSFGENTEYIIESGKTAVLDFQWFIDNQAKLRINSGATLQVNHTLNIAGTASFQLDSNATCIYNSTSPAAATIFGGTESFHLYSNFTIKNWSGLNDPITSPAISYSGPVNHSYLFGNLELNWENQVGNWNMNFNSLNSLNLLAGNNFKVTSTGIGKILIPAPNSPGSGSFIQVNNYIQTGGEVDLALGSPVTNGFASILDVYGNFQKTGGIIDANSVTTYGVISFRTQDTTNYNTFENSGLFRNNAVALSATKLKLLSDLPIFTTNTQCTFISINSTIDCNNFKVTGNTRIQFGSTVLKLRNSEGFKNGATGGDFPIACQKEFSNTTFEFCGSSAQITGDSLPANLAENPLSGNQNIIINNPNGITLSKDTRMGPNSYLSFIQGKFNLGDNNFKIGNQDSVYGINQNSFFNTNGSGCLRIGLDQGYTAKFPIGNNTFSPLYITQAYGGNTDTLGIRVENGFGSHSPFDTSRSVRKIWRIIDDNVPNGTYFHLAVQFMKSDAGVNMNFGTACAIGQYDSGYNGYVPKGANIYDQFYSPPDSTNSKAIYGTTFSTTGDDYFVAGNEEGVFETYFPDNSGDASILGNWSSLNGGIHPPSFDRYAIFSVPQGQTASFNNPVAFSDKAYLRSSGNGIINANAPLTINGILEINDSSTYNHNNTGVASQTCFAGREFCHRKSNFNILKWSDTADKIFDENELSFGNLTINFNNLPEPFGANKYWTLFKNIAPYYTDYIIRGNLTYLNSSSYQFAPIGYGDNITSLTVYGNVQIGDSLNLTGNPVMNLSGGTTRAAGSTAGTLYICGNLDIQNGGLTSQDFPAVARGKIIFKREVNNVSQSHTFYCYNPFLPQTSNLGNSSFPNQIAEDTLTLKSDMYHWASGSFLLTDVWQVNSGAVLNIDTFRLKCLNLTVKNGGSLITKNADGFNADMANQTVTFESNSILEFAGNTQQNFQKAGGYNLASFPNIIINNPLGVTVNTAGINITNSINFINGKINSDNTNYLTLPGTIQFNGASSNSFLNGPLKINTSATNTITIPTGKGGVLRSVGITPTSSASTDWMVEYFNQAQTFGNTLGAGIISVSQSEYFLINRSGTSDARVGLYWGANSGVTNPANLRVARWNDFQWEDKGNYSYTGDNTGGVVFSNVVTNFSPFAIASTDYQQLPVELSSFNSSTDKNNVTLSWATETEVNNSGFEIERKLSSDTSWKKINFVNGAGNSHTTKTYKYEDRNLATGKYKYRLKQIDFNGNYTYFNLQNEINVGLPVKFNLSQNYPNPFNPTTKINYDLPFDSKVQIKIFDMTGREVYQLVNESLTAGYYRAQFNGSAFASGTYFYQIVANGGNQSFTKTMKMVLVK